ncbi:MAG: hypothetical protein ACKVWV_15875 [Planctomycetota bacterium]
MHDETALALDQDRHRERREQARVLESLQFAERKDAGPAAVDGGAREETQVDLAAVLGEQRQAVCDGLLRAAVQARALADRELGDEASKERQVQARLLEPVVEAEGLQRERSAADATQKALDETAIAATCEETLARPQERAAGVRVAGGEGTKRRLVRHQKLLRGQPRGSTAQS